jgi:pimeloyl-ACP methyl ester carboxylesterase
VRSSPAWPKTDFTEDLKKIDVPTLVMHGDDDQIVPYLDAGAVLAPHQFYSSRGKKANSVEPALKLLARFTSEFNVDVRLAVWDPKLSNIKSWVDSCLTGKAEVIVDC